MRSLAFGLFAGSLFASPLAAQALPQAPRLIELPDLPPGVLAPSVVRDPQELSAVNAGTNDGFGVALALSGDTLAVGAFEEDGAGDGPPGVPDTANGVTNAGAVYVYVRDGAGWALQAYLKADNAPTLGGSSGVGDGFGGALALQGDTLVVGAIGEDSAATGVDGDGSDQSAEDAGAAYVFERVGTTWTQTAYLKASNTDEDDHFGSAVAISGDTIVVGAVDEDGMAVVIDGDQTTNFLNSAGAAYVFVRDGGTWVQQAYLKASNTRDFPPDPLVGAAGDRFASSVAIDGDTVVVGATHEDGPTTGVNPFGQHLNTAENAGAAYVFERVGSSWSQTAYLKASNTAETNAFGNRVAVLGDTIAVAARRERGLGAGVGADQTQVEPGPFPIPSDIGAVYVFVRNAGSWAQQEYIKAPNADSTDNFGGSVALGQGGDLLLVGAYNEDSAATGVDGDMSDESAGANGAGYLFRRDGGAWRELAYLKGSTDPAQPNARIGNAAAISGSRLALGAFEQWVTGLQDAGVVFTYEDALAFTHEGSALPGALGPPRLLGTGTLDEGSVNTIVLSGAAPSAAAGVFVAFASTPTPFKGGTLLPVPWAALAFTNTLPDGSLPLAFLAPSPALPPGTEIWGQVAIVDASAPVGVALSNAILGVAP